MNSILEVIALDAADARAAEEGGADRIELVSGMDQGGLTPSVAAFTAVRAATRLPIRVMLRADSGFGWSPRLVADARELVAHGADQFVLGFLDDRGHPDRTALDRLLPELGGAPWTFHRAIDAAVSRTEIWSDLRGADAVLTAGSAAGVDAGLRILAAEAADGRPILAGGGLRAGHVPTLRAAGVRAFHSGTAVRADGTWQSPVDAGRVAQWAALVSA